jgi:hypothetical protein
MSVEISRITSGTVRFFFSKDVKIFPCTYRGYFKGSQDSITTVFDPESRLISEYNYTHLLGLVGDKASYVVEYTPYTGDSHGKLVCVIDGYYLELSNLDLDFRDTAEIKSFTDFLNANQTVSLKICTVASELSDMADDETRYLTYLTSMHTGSNSSLDLLVDSTTKTYYCTAIALCAGEHPTEDYFSESKADSTIHTLYLKQNGKIVYENFLQNLILPHSENAGSVTPGLENLELGYRSAARGTESTAVGTYAITETQGGREAGTAHSAATAVGAQASALADNSVALGAGAVTHGKGSIAIGGKDGSTIYTHADNEGSIAIGFDAKAGSSGKAAIAIGADTRSLYIDSIAIGDSASAGNARAIVIGADNAATKTDEVLIGNGLISSERAASVVVGNYNESDIKGQVVIASGTDNEHRHTSCVFNQEGKTQIFEPTTVTDALEVAGDTSLQADLEVLGRVDVGQDIDNIGLTVTGDTTLDKSLTVKSGGITLNAGALKVEDASEQSEFAGSLYVKKALVVDAATTFGSTLMVGGNTDLRGTLAVTNGVTAKSGLTTQGNLQVGGTASFQQEVTLQNNLKVQGNVEVSNTKNVLKIDASGISVSTKAGSTSTKSMHQLFFDISHPVNSIFTTVDTALNTAAKVANYFLDTYGVTSTWEVFAAGKTIIGADPDYTVGTTGGQASFTINKDNLPKHTHGISSADGHSHELNAHRHGVSITTTSAGEHYHIIEARRQNGTDEDANWRVDIDKEAGTGYGYSSAFKCDEDGNHTHGVSGDTEAAGGSTKSAGSHSHTVAENAGVDSLTIDLRQPYVVCYQYKRKT